MGGAVVAVDGGSRGAAKIPQVSIRRVSGAEKEGDIQSPEKASRYYPRYPLLHQLNSLICSSCQTQICTH
ncbi:unnamed protein product [Linum tenue]|uniref:Uncharacterized protein n=1 Tax=Linum tenue TaxID=586396 RepID=A0AAV0PIV7_9ROSI|nr:unnamed protein product [Linum tenue]